MKKHLACISLLLFASLAIADTPPPGTVKAKTWSGDGNTAVTTTGTALDVNVTNASGLTTVNQGNAGVQAWPVDASGHTVPVSGTFWQTTQPVSGNLGRTWSLLNTTDSVNVGNFPATFGISSLPSLAAGSNTIGNVNINGTVPVSGTITTTNTANGDTGSAVPTQATQVAGSDGTNLRAVKVSSAGVVAVDASGSTVPVSGTVTANAGTGTFTVDASGHTVPVSGTFWQATQPVSAVSLPLPTGAATSAKQPALGTAGSPSSDVITVQGATSMTALKVDGSAVTQPVSAASLPLPSGAATSANQTTGNNSLSTIATNTGNIPPQGQALAAASMPVVLPASQITALTPPTTIAATQSGTWTTGRTWSLLNSTDSVNAVQSGTWNINNVSGTVSLPTGAATSANQTNGTQQTQIVQGGNTATVSAGGALKVDGSSSTQPVSGTVTANAGTGNFTVVQSTGSNLHVQVDSAPSTAVTQSGTWNVNSTPVVPTALTVKSAAITVGTSAVRLTNNGSATPSTRVLLAAQLLSTSTANCFLGPSTVTSSGSTRGIQMFAGQSFSFTNDAGDYYAICDSASQTFFVTEQE